MSLSPRAFQVVPKGDRWLALGHQGEVIGSFTRKEHAEQAVATRKRIYEFAHGQQAPRTLSQGAEEAASAEVAKAGRPLAEQSAEAAPQAQQLLEFAAQPKPAAEQSAPALTPEDLEKALAKQKAPPGKPVSTARAARSQQPPNLAQASGEVERKRRGKRGEAKERQRRRKLADTLGQGVEASGGFVLEDPSTGLSAHELSAMLAKGLGGNPAAPAVQPAAAPPAGPSAQPAAQPIPQPVTRGRAASPPAAPIGRRSTPPPPANPITVAASSSPKPPATALSTRPPVPGPATLGPRDVRIPNLKNTAQAAAQAKTLPIPRTSAGPAPQQHTAAGKKTPATNSAQPPRSNGPLAGIAGALSGIFSGLADKLVDVFARKLSALNLAGSPAKAGKAKGGKAAPSLLEAAAGVGQTGSKYAPANVLGRMVGAAQAIRGNPHMEGSELGKGGAQVGGAIGAVFGPEGAAIGTVLGKVAGESLQLAKSFAELPSKIEEFTSSMLDGARELRQFNSSVANSFAMLDRQQLVLSGRQAAATAGTTRSLAQSEMALRNAIQPQRELWANVRNVVGVGFAKVGTALATIVNSMLFLERINDWLQKRFGGAETQKGPPPFEFLDRVSEGKWDMPKNSDPRNGA